MSTSSRVVPIPAPRRSGLILAGGGVSAAAVLSAWLLYWLIFCQTLLRPVALWVEPPNRASAATSLLFQREDARALDPAAAPVGGTLRDEVNARLSNAGRNPSVVFLSAVGFRASDARGRPGDVYLASPEILDGVLPGSQFRAPQGMALSDLIDAFRSRPGRRLGPRLLILDVSRVGTDRELGLFGDDIVGALKELVPPPPDRSSAGYAEWADSWKGFAVFCAGDSGQWSHASDPDGRSVFGHYVSEALGRGREENRIADAGQLIDFVTNRVAVWSRDHVPHARNGPAQTPIVLGDPGLRLVIPRNLIPPPPPAPAPEALKEARAAFEDRHLKPAYELERDARDRALFALDPFAWRNFRAALLRVERFHRAGAAGDAGDALRDLDAAAAALQPFGAGVGALPGLVVSGLGSSDPATREAARSTGSNILSPPPPVAPAPADEADPSGVKPAPAPPVLRGAFTETRLTGWTETYARILNSLGGDEDFAKGRSAEVSRATRLRFLAEGAAAPWPSHPWLDRFVAEGDARRHAAEDALFDDDLSLVVRDGAAAATSSYESAGAVARALTLAARVATDLPPLGAWHVRQRARQNLPADRELLGRIVAGTLSLNGFLDRAYDDTRSAPDLSELKARVDALAAAFNKLENEFRAECGRAVQSKDWEAVNDLLAAPGIPPDLRRTLVEASTTLAESSRLSAPADPDGPEAEKPSALAEAGKRALNNDFNARSVVQGQLSQRSSGARDDAYWAVGGGPRFPQAADPAYRLTAVGMGLLEWCLLKIGGAADPADLAALDAALERAGAAPSGSAAADPLERVGPIVRDLRARLVAQLRDRTPATDAEWAATERAWLSLPAAADRAAVARFRQQMTDRRRTAFLTRQARRALDDLDTAAAAVYLGLVPDAMKRDEGVRALDERRAALSVVSGIKREKDAPVTLDADRSPAMLLTFLLGSGTELPAGTASFAVGGDHEGKVVLSPEEGGSAWGVEGVAVGGKSGGKVTLRVAKSGAINAEDVVASLDPVAFFRGLVFKSDGPVAVNVARVTREFNIELGSSNLAQHNKAIDGRRTVLDQFVKHPNECYLYTGSNTAVRVGLTYIPEPGKPEVREVLVTALLDGRPAKEGLNSKAARVTEPSRIKVKASAPATAYRSILLDSADVKEGNTGSVLSIVVRNEADEPVARRDVKIFAIDPSPYYPTAMTQQDVPGPGGEPLKLFTLTVRRSREDPTSRDILVSASMLVPPVAWFSVVHSVPGVNRRNLGQREPIWPLLQDESVQFSFLAPPGFEAQANAPGGLQYIVNVGDNRLRQAPLPLPHGEAPPPQPPGTPPAPAPGGG